MINGDKVTIHGDGETSRDFCFIDNAVQANILAATAPAKSRNQVYNVAVGDRSTLNQLHEILRNALAQNGIVYTEAPIHGPPRAGDIRHSQANVDKAERMLGYERRIALAQGIEKAMPWYLQLVGERSKSDPVHQHPLPANAKLAAAQQRIGQVR
jgi:UDP-N-acetylglucosamine 4-epimerase